MFSLRKHPFLLAPRSQRRRAKRNGCFRGLANVLLAKAQCWNSKREGKWLLFLLSLIVLCHNIKDGGYNSTNINKQLSPAQNTPALQVIAICPPVMYANMCAWVTRFFAKATHCLSEGLNGMLAIAMGYYKVLPFSSSKELLPTEWGLFTYKLELFKLEFKKGASSFNLYWDH